MELAGRQGLRGDAVAAAAAAVAGSGLLLWQLGAVFVIPVTVRIQYTAFLFGKVHVGRTVFRG